MSSSRQVLFNTLENIISADLNRVGALAGKAVMDSVLQAESGMLHTTPRDVVLRGLGVTAGAGLSVDIDPGALARFNVAVAADASQYELGAITAQENVSGLTPDGASDRIALISAAIASIDTDSSTRNVLTLPGRTVAPTSVDKTRIPDLTFTVTLGVPGAVPAFPATPANEVALFYVYLPAAAASVTDNFIMDARVLFAPAALSRAHERSSGLLGGMINLTDVIITSGRGYQNGGLVDMANDISLPHADLTADGAGVIAASTEYHVYVVSRSSGDPVGKNVQDGVVPIIATTVPNSDGRPSAALTYRPLYEHGVNNIRRTTLNALWVGVLHSDALSQYQIGGDGIPLNRDGTISHQFAEVRGHVGWPGQSPGWLKPPVLTWVNTNTVSIGTCSPVIAGIPGLTFGGSATMPGSLVSGDVETANTFYYVYLRNAIPLGSITRGAVRSYVIVISSEAPTTTGGKPTPEAGFSAIDYLFAGSFFNNNASDIQEFYRSGTLVRWNGAPTNAPFVIFNRAEPSTFPTLDTITALSPALPRRRAAHVELQLEVTGTVGTTSIFVRAGTGTGRNRWAINKTNFATGILTASDGGVNEFDVGLSSANQFEMTEAVGSGAGTVDVEIRQVGYYEDVENP